MKAGGLKKGIVNARISRVTNGSGPDFFELRIEDEASGLIIVEARLDDAQFANLLSNRQAARLPAEVNVSDKLLKQHECKTVHIPFSCEGFDKEERQLAIEVTRALAERQNPGWTADTTEYNSYRHSYKDKTYAITIRRWVEK